jgi:holo-[acyl-carrier protein] synthase
MIAGIGTDIIKIDRMRALFERHGKSFIERIFSKEEKQEAATRNNPIEYYAGRWAGKEAVSKALNCGIGKDCSWQDINIKNDSRGCPQLTLHGHAAERAANMNAHKFHISISHEKEYACAVVILEG